ncbi:MAG: hypothetical protein AB7D07_06625 [Desulfovibrionaceae bacterium]
MKRTLMLTVAMAALLLTPCLVVAEESNAFVQYFDNGQINWQTGMITATGIGAPPANAVNMAQKRGMAVRAATVVARRNLLEIVKGVQIDSATTVEDYMVTSDVVVSQVSGFLQNSKVMGPPTYLSDGSVEITVGIPLHGRLSGLLIPNNAPFKTMAAPEPKAQPTPEPEPKAQPTPETPAVNYTGLLIDARGLSLRPAMSPKIVDENGEEVYGSVMVSREYAIQQGMAGYAKNVESAAQNPRIASTPLQVKAKDVSGKARTNLMVSNDQAQQIKQLSKDSDVLEKCKVMIVLD